MAAAISGVSVPFGAEVLPPAEGAAPWERSGVAVGAPHNSEAQARAEKWRKAAGDDEQGAPSREDAKRRRAAERRARKEQAAAELARKLEVNARRMYVAGFFALPLLWLVSIFYFHKEHTAAEGNPVIKKYYRNSRIMLILYTAIFVTWFILFQVKSDTFLRSLNIIYFTGQSPSGF